MSIEIDKVRLYEGDKLTLDVLGNFTCTLDVENIGGKIIVITDDPIEILTREEHEEKYG